MKSVGVWTSDKIDLPQGDKGMTLYLRRAALIFRIQIPIQGMILKPMCGLVR